MKSKIVIAVIVIGILAALAINGTFRARKSMSAAARQELIDKVQAAQAQAKAQEGGLATSAPAMAVSVSEHVMAQPQRAMAAAAVTVAVAEPIMSVSSLRAIVVAQDEYIAKLESKLEECKAK